MTSHAKDPSVHPNASGAELGTAWTISAASGSDRRRLRSGFATFRRRPDPDATADLARQRPQRRARHRPGGQALPYSSAPSRSFADLLAHASRRSRTALSQVPILDFLGLHALLAFLLRDQFHLPHSVVDRSTRECGTTTSYDSREHAFWLRSNTSLTQGSITWYRFGQNRRIGFLDCARLGAVHHNARNIYELFFMFSTLSIIFHAGSRSRRMRIVAILRIVYIAASALLAGIMTFFALPYAGARIHDSVRDRRAAHCSRRSSRRVRSTTLMVPGDREHDVSRLGRHAVAARWRCTKSRSVHEADAVSAAGLLAAALGFSGSSSAPARPRRSCSSRPTRRPRKSSPTASRRDFTFMLCDTLIGLVFLPRARRADGVGFKGDSALQSRLPDLPRTVRTEPLRAVPLLQVSYQA